MSAGLRVIRFSGLAVVAALLLAAGCAADGSSVNASETGDNDDAGTMPETGGTPPDAGPDDEVVESDAAVPPKCGNHKVETGETCDDGNLTDNDGCSGSCTLETAFEGDTCPGKALTFTKAGELLTASVTGSTAGAFNHYGSACGGGSGKDVVYTFTPTTSGKAIVTLAADFTAIVSARSTCDLSTSESECADLTEPTGGTTTMQIPVFAGTPAFLFVDGYGGSTGTFTLDVQLSQAQCGNGVAELPEACDDGNSDAGDGCSPTCTLEAGGIITQCPGQPFALTGPAGQPRKISFSGNTLTQGASTQSSAGCFYSSGPNVVYAFKSDVDGSVEADLVAGYTKVGLHARTDCGDSDFQIGCTQRETPGLASLTFPTKANGWFYVIVDGNSISSRLYGGPFTLDVTVTPAACQNHVLDGNEECDDGNAIAGDGCSPSCTIEAIAGTDTCPGYALALAPQTDGSRTASISGKTTNLTSNHTACGLSGGSPDAVFAVTPDIDGYLTANTTSSFNTSIAIRKFCEEKNPDGGTIPEGALYACSYKASIPSDQTLPWVIQGMGSGPKSVGVPVLANTTYWVVVDGNDTTASGTGTFELRVAVRPPVCGNGIIEGAETCDDGAAESNDGCDSTCKLEPITSRSTCADAEVITLTETTPGSYAASLARGTTNLLANSNISSSTLDDDKPCWAVGKNAFFSVTSPAGGVLRATAKSDAFDVVLNFRKPSCALTTAPYVCGNDSAKGGEESIATPLAAGEQVWIVVDGKDAVEMGRFSLDLTLSPSGCGDGFYVPGPDEECDDGNKVAGDGCDPSCKLETLSGVDICPGRALTLTTLGSQQPYKGTITLDTSKLNADYSGACGGGAREGVVKVTAPISGFLRARTRGMPSSTVYARTTCNDPSTEISKASTTSCTSVVHEEVAFQVTAGTDYFLFVDGLDGAVGVPSLDVTLSP